MKKRIISMLLAAGLVAGMLPVIALTASANATGYYHAEGRDIIDPEGNVALLKGISFGNKNYSNPSSVDGTGVRNDHDAASYQELAAMGLDHVRFEFNYGLFEDDDNVGVYKQAGFDWIDENIAAAKAAGIKLILQMKSPQGGYQNATKNMYGPDSGGKALWIDLDENGNVLPTENYKQNQDRLVNLWKAIAEYYKDEPAIIGYGLLNEPAVPQKDTSEQTVGQWKDLAQRIASAIRTVDNNHILFVENMCSYFLPGNYDATDWNQVSLSDSQFTINDTNTVYEFHFYEPLKYTHQGADWLTSTYGDCYYDGISVAELEINDWNSKGMQYAAPVSSDGGWTYFESETFTLTDTYNVAQPQINMSAMPANSSIWIDDLTITRTNVADGTTVSVLYSDFTDSVGGFFKVWNGNDDYNAIEIDSSVGYAAPGAMKLTNNLSTEAHQWANAQSWDNIILEEGYTYKISCWVKGGTDWEPCAYFLQADAAWLMNKEYLSYLLDQYCAFGVENEVPMHVGEWGFHYECYDKGAEEYVKDLTALFEEKGLSSNYHSYHDSTFGLYLSEEWAERPERNGTLYELLTTYYCTPAEVLEGEVDSWNVTLEDDLYVSFLLDIRQSVEDTASVCICIGHKAYTYRIQDLQKTDDGLYIAGVHIAAAQMTDGISVTVVNEGSRFQSQPYTVRQYADTLLADDGYSQYHALVREMLNYGAAAQDYFDYGEENPANEGISNAGTAEIPDTANEALSVSGGADGVRFCAASLMFRNKIAVRYYFECDGNINAYTFTANGETCVPQLKDGLYCVEVADILPQNLDQQIELTVTDTDGNMLIIRYGPMNYIVRMNENGSEALKVLVKALYNYHLAAKELCTAT